MKRRAILHSNLDRSSRSDSRHDFFSRLTSATYRIDPEAMEAHCELRFSSYGAPVNDVSSEAPTPRTSRMAGADLGAAPLGVESSWETADQRGDGTTLSLGSGSVNSEKGMGGYLHRGGRVYDVCG
jgi:hypothetical protein